MKTKVYIATLMAALLAGCASGHDKHITYECVRDSYQLPEFATGETYKDVVDFEQKCLSELVQCAAE